MREKTNFWDQAGLTLWDYKIDSLRVAGMSEDDARNAVVMEWMRAGDFRPLLAMIKNSRIGLRGPVLGLLAQMLASGQLVLRAAGPGRPPDPEAAVRSEFVADVYDDCRKSLRDDDAGGPVRSEVLFEAVGKMAGVGDESVKKAVKAKRKQRP